MKMPNFLIIGAAKSGTSSLYEYLNQHPEIYMSPVKEPSFFAIEGERLDIRGPSGPAKRPDWVAELSAYQALFTGVQNEKAIGEASILYLYHPKAPERIQRHIPETKLIAVLRNPVDRAYSSFCFLTEHAAEPIEDFAQALEAEEARIQDHWEHLWHYKNMGFYFQQLKRYFDRFDRSQIQVYLYEDFNRDNLTVIQDIFQFLNVDPNFIPNTSTRYLESGIPKNRKLQNMFFRSRFRKMMRNYLPKELLPFVQILKNYTVSKSLIPAELRQRLVEVYREDILCLQDLLQKDLSQWLEPKKTSSELSR